MATGSGKTTVMGMLIAWHALNSGPPAGIQRYSDTFLIVTPGITIRDRLRVLLPNDPANYYRQRDVIPSHELEQLGQAKIVITNFHAFKLREKISAGKLTKDILAQGTPGAFTETPDQMVRRVCRELGTKKTSSCSTTRRITATGTAPRPRRKSLPETTEGSGKTRAEAKRPHLDHRLEAIKARWAGSRTVALSMTCRPPRFS